MKEAIKIVKDLKKGWWGLMEMSNAEQDVFHETMDLVISKLEEQL